MPVATFVFARHFFKELKRSWATYSLLSGIGALLFFLLTSLSIVASMNPEQTVGLLNLYTVGLMERVMVIILFLWVTSLAAYMLQTASVAKSLTSRLRS